MAEMGMVKGEGGGQSGRKSNMEKKRERATLDGSAGLIR